MNTNSHLTAEEANAFCQPPGAPGPRLAPIERLAVSDHAAACPACRALVSAAATSRTENTRRAAMRDARTMAGDARRGIAHEDEDRQAFASFLETFPEERFEPGGTLPVPVTRPLFTKRGEETRWWEALFSHSIFEIAGPAVALALLVVFVMTLASHRKSVPETSPQVAVAAPLLRDGPVVVAADGSLQTGVSLPEDLRVAVLDAIRKRALRVPTALLAGVMRGGDGNVSTPDPQKALSAIAPYPVSPSSGSTVESQLPRLRWTSVQGAGGCQVEIASTATDEKIMSPPLPSSATGWQPTTPLTRGCIYHWRVLAGPGLDKEVEGANPASFKVLSETEEEKLRQLRAGPSVSHLALAVAYLRLNLLPEAKRELVALAAKDPNSALAAQLRDSLPQVLE